MIRSCSAKSDGSVPPQVSHTIINYWVNFAHSGDPNAIGLPPWDATAVLEIGRSMVAGPAPKVALCKVWEELHPV